MVILVSKKQILPFPEKNSMFPSPLKMIKLLE